MESLRIKLEELIQSKHLLSHSFYTRWTAGELSKEELKGYACEYYAFEKEFPRFISSIHSNTENIEHRQSLLENLIEEERGENNHPELWLRFAEGLGLERDQVKNHFHSDETEFLMRNYRNHCTSGNVVNGLAALYVYERQQPDVARQKVDGLRRFYGLTDDRPVEFFKVHQAVDVLHSETEISLLTQLCEDEDSKQSALLAAQKSLDALYEFLDGIERRYQPRV